MKPHNRTNGHRLRLMKPVLPVTTTSSANNVINILDDDDDDDENDNNVNEGEDDDLLFDDKKPFLGNKSKNKSKNSKISKTNRSNHNNNSKSKLDYCLDDEDDQHQFNSLDSDSSFSIGKIKIIKPVRYGKRRARLKCFCCLSLVISIFSLIAYLIYYHKFHVIADLISSVSSISSSSSTIKLPCDQINVTSKWHSTFPMLTIESALRLVDVDNDGSLDPIIAFGTGADVAYYPPVVCQVYFNLTEEQSNQGCGGGLMALNGKTGKLIWRQYTRHELFAVNCELDVTGDGVKDCIVGGRMASMYAFNGATGQIIWSYLGMEGEPLCGTSNFYTPLYLSKDMDHDGLPELILMHGGDPLRSPRDKTRLVARLIIASSRTGKILSWSKVPDKGESYYSPQRLTRSDGSEFILFGTGGETRPGSLWIVPLDSLFHGNMHGAHAIYSDCCKGIMVPPVLVDINGDSELDIIMSLFNSTVIAFDGLTFRILWKYTFPGSETYSTPAVGYFNDDNVPDFFVSYQFGPGFPIYYYSQANVLDGRTGKPLLKQPINMLVGTQSSPLTISTNGANDVFLFWLSTCDNVNQSTSNLEPFKVLPGTTVHQASRADFCSIRFNSTLYTQLIGLTRDRFNVIYDSRLNRDKEQISIDYAAIGEQWLADHQDTVTANQDPTGDPYDIGQLAVSPSPSPSPAPSEVSVITPSVFDYVRPDIMDYPSNPYTRTKRLFNKNHHHHRNRRHVGVHDGDGVQRVISTGTLAPSESPNSIDLIFTTYWFPPSKGVKIVSKEMKKCLEKYLTPKMENRLRLGPKAKFKGHDHDAYVEIVEEGCANLTGLNLTEVKDDYDPYNRPMGAMTVYRVTIKCANTLTTIRTYSDQIWPSYMGKNADCLANKGNLKLT